MKNYLERVFTEEEICKIIDYGCIMTEDNQDEAFNVVHTETIDHDREKNSTDVEYVIEEAATGKFWKTVLLDSVWIGQDSHNASQKWYEVKPRTIKTVVYE